MAATPEERFAAKEAARTNRKTYLSLEEVIDMLAAHDDKERGECAVFIETTGGERFPISYVEFDPEEDKINIG